MTARSHLYVPGDEPEKLAKAALRNADALIIDLEDAVAPQSKQAAREIVRNYLDGLGIEADEGPELWLRINPGAEGLRDIESSWHPRLRGVIVAKAETLASIDKISAALDEVEQRAGVKKLTDIVLLLETARGYEAAKQLAGRERVIRLQLGEADLRAELRLAGKGGDVVLTSMRTRLILISAAAGLEPPIAPVSTNFKDLEEFEKQSRFFAGMGFAGRSCIHPAQIGVVNAVFAPSPEEIDWARTLVAEFDAHVATGSGVMVDTAGQMIDEAIVRRARTILETNKKQSAT